MIRRVPSLVSRNEYDGNAVQEFRTRGAALTITRMTRTAYFESFDDGSTYLLNAFSLSQNLPSVYTDSLYTTVSLISFIADSHTLYRLLRDFFSRSILLDDFLDIEPLKCRWQNNSLKHFKVRGPNQFFVIISFGHTRGV